MFFPSVSEYLWVLYPELHYRFRYFKFSRYFLQQPEIVVDIPRRVVSKRMPVVILVRDAHLFPLEFTGDLKLEIHPLKYNQNRRPDKIIRHFQLPFEKIASPWWHILLYIDLPLGEYYIYAHLSFKSGGKESKIINHNFPGLPFSPLMVAIQSGMRKPEGYLLGDMHCHSAYTQDQVEFGMPLEPLAILAKASGKDFVAVTDHSYDLDDEVNDYLRNDPKLKKWYLFKEELSALNARQEPSMAHLLLGQEITVRNCQNKNVHLLLIGEDKLFPGSGDSAEKWFKTYSEHSIPEIIGYKSSNSIIASAHPRTKAKFLEKVLLKRGKWEEEDLSLNLNGVQIANGDADNSLEEGLHYWERTISTEKRIALWGGNDAHGNFNRFRQIKFPMLSLQEKGSHIFGQNFTGVYSPAGVKGIYEGLRKGNTFISDGLMVGFKVNEAHPGEVIPAGKAMIEIDTFSEELRSQLRNLTLVIKEETGLKEYEIITGDGGSCNIKYEIDLKRGWIYLKGENRQGEYYISSAIYIK